MTVYNHTLKLHAHEMFIVFHVKFMWFFGKPRKILNIYVNQIIMLYFFTWLILESGLGPEAIESPGKYDNRLSH